MPRKQTGQSLRGDNHQPEQALGRLVIQKPLGMKQPRNQVRIVRFLLSKTLLWEEELSDREQYTLAEILLTWENLKDKQFREKHERLKELIEVYLDADLREDLGVVLKQWTLALGRELLQHPRMYFSEKKLLSGLFVVIKRVWSRIRPKAYIGVGYTDKGNCRIASKDASPAWQEVAMDLSWQQRTAEAETQPVGIPGQPWSGDGYLGPPIPKRNWVRERIDDHRFALDRYVRSSPDTREVYPFLF